MRVHAADLTTTGRRAARGACTKLFGRQRGAGLSECLISVTRGESSKPTPSKISRSRSFRGRRNLSIRSITRCLGWMKAAYGDCVACGEEIPERCLRALPFATRCKDCEEALEVVEERVRVGDRRLDGDLAR